MMSALVCGSGIYKEKMQLLQRQQQQTLLKRRKRREREGAMRKKRNIRPIHRTSTCSDTGQFSFCRFLFHLIYSVFFFCSDKRRYQDYECSQKGLERAQYLSWFFWKLVKIDKQKIGAIIVPKSGGACQNSYRPIQTVEPTAAYFKMAIETPFCTTQNWETAHYLLTGKPKGFKVVAYEHRNLPVLAHLLGVVPQPPEWPGDRFDLMFHIKTNVSGGLAQLTITPQGILPGDSPILPVGYRPWGLPNQPTNAFYCIMPWTSQILIAGTVLLNIFLGSLFLVSCICVNKCSARRTMMQLFRPSEYEPIVSQNLGN
jgi:hypothetical protein